LVSLRWPNDFECPQCGSRRLSLMYKTGKQSIAIFKLIIKAFVIRLGKGIKKYLLWNGNKLFWGLIPGFCFTNEY